MGNYSMPGYFQTMPVAPGKAFRPSPENVAELKAIEADVHAKIKEMMEAGTPDETLHKRGQLTAMERVMNLIDAGSWCPLNSLYNPEGNHETKTGVVSTGILKGLGRIGGKWAVIIASDNKKLAGAWVAGQADNLLRGSDTAKLLGIPLVYVLNCSGVKLDEQEKVYPNRRGGGTPFYRNSELNQMGVPVIVGIYGTNPAGGGYHSISPTILIAHQDANMAVGGAGIVGGMSPKGHVDKEAAEALIKAQKNLKSDIPGTVAIHYGETGFFREVYADEEGVLAGIRKYIDMLPAYDPEFFRVDDPKEPLFDANDLYSIVPFNQKRSYDMVEVLARLFDGSEFMEYKHGYGPEMITGLAKIDGLLVGVVANYQGMLMNYPEYKMATYGQAMGVGGKLYRQGLIKMNEFVTLCARDRIPMIWIQDTTGIDVGDDAEVAELLGLGQSLIYSIQSSKLPMMEITLRRGTAAVAVWLALGALGVPVFAGFNGGIAYMLGSTGGYLWGFLLWAPMEGFLFRLGKGKLPLLILGMAAGLALCYTFGTAWFMVVYARTTGPVALSTVLGWCVLPYLVPDAVKLAMAVPLILKGRKHVRS